MTLRTGTSIEMHGCPEMGAGPERATIARWTKVSGLRMDGWHIVKFANGAKLCVHEGAFRIVENR